MPVRRTVFRIEEMRQAEPPRGNAPAPPIGRTRTEAPLARATDPGAGRLRQLKDETDNIFRAVHRTKQEIAALHVSGLGGTDNGRVRQELDAVVGGAEQAIQQILAAAEEIDETANTLSAVLKHAQNQSLAQDIREHVIRIFEACNFHDLTGQRISKVLTTLQFVEERVDRMMEIWGGIEAFQAHAVAARVERDQRAPFLNGPKLDGDLGHASQTEIDALFKRG